MPVARITMRKIKDVLRLKLDAQLSHERIAASLGLSKGVVTKYVSLAAAAQLDWPTIQGLDEADLHRRLMLAPVKHSDVVLPDYGYIHHELRRTFRWSVFNRREHATGYKVTLFFAKTAAQKNDGQTYISVRVQFDKPASPE